MKLPFIFAKRFVAGESFDQAVSKVETLNNLGIHVTLDLLGENVNNRKTADETVEAYIDLLNGIEKQKLRSTISIKLTMMGLDIDYNYCLDNLYKLLDATKKHNQFVRIDMEGTSYTQQTVDIFKEAHQKYGKEHVGIVIQAYLHRSPNDINELSEMNADIRLCKGAYKEPACLAIQNMPEIREAYKKMAAKLLKKTSYPRFATHDDELIDWIYAYTDEINAESSQFEFQMLYGLRQNTCEEMAANGYNVRVYVPYGTMWLPYFTRRLTERKENIWFVFSNLLKQ